MKAMKLLFTGIIITLITAGTLSAQNAINNGNFETLGTDNLPVGWEYNDNKVIGTDTGENGQGYGLKLDGTNEAIASQLLTVEDKQVTAERVYQLALSHKILSTVSQYTSLT